MAGRIQHYIPQSFQRGFFIPEKPNQTHVYRTDKAYISNINRVAAKRDFYSKPSGTSERTLDDIITNYEDRLGNLLHQLRNLDIGDSANASVAAEVIAHLTPRGNSARSIFSSGAKNLISGASELFSDKLELIFQLGLDTPSPNKTWNELVFPFIDKEEEFNSVLEIFHIQTKIPKTVFYRLIFIYSRESLFSESNPLSGLIQKIFSNLYTRIDDMVSNAQKQTLNKGLIAEVRKQALEEFTWSISSAPREGAIMPDCIAIGFDEKEGIFLPYIMTSNTSLVVMPLTSKKLLVGVYKDSITPNLSDFNQEASECSDELFISSLFHHLDLQKNIGMRWRRKIDSIVQDTLNDIKSPKYLKSNDSSLKSTAEPTSLQLSFTDHIEEIDKFIISKKVQNIFAKLRYCLDLTCIDEIIFTSNFGKTLTNTALGFDATLLPEGMPDFIFQGAAAILVLRDNKLKVHIVLDINFASILHNANKNTNIVLHLLVAGFSLADTVNQFEKKLPGFLMEPVSYKDHDAVLHCAMRKALRAYKYAYDSAEFGAKNLFEQEYSSYLIHALGESYAAIDKAKKEHLIDYDYPKLFSAIHSAATNILIASARFIGHMEGIGKELLSIDSTVADKINSLQLAGWISVFAYDLHKFWGKESWIREDFYALNIHFERLLYSKGIFLYASDDGTGTVIWSSQAN